MNTNELITIVQDLRAALDMKPLGNPAKLGKAKLEDMRVRLAHQLHSQPLCTLTETEPPAVIPAIVGTPPVEPVGVAQSTPHPAFARTEPKTEEPKPVVKQASIKELACTLLCETVDTIDGRSVGMSYSDVLARILEQRPNAKTSLNCLRWYAGKIRILADGYFNYKLPQMRHRGGVAKEEKES